MAWTYLTGVQEPFANHFTTTATSSTQTNIDEVHTGAIRMIYRNGEQATAKPHIQMLVNHGKFVIPTLDYSFSSVGQQVFRDDITKWANTLKGLVSVVEIGNEPSFNANEWELNGTGQYFARLRDAIDIFNTITPGIDVVMGSPPTGPDLDFLTAANLNTFGPSIWGLLDGVGVHPYSSVPGTTLTGAGSLGHTKTFRDKLDSYGAAAAALPLWITEFGWSTQDHKGVKGNLVVNSEQQQQDYLQQAYTNWALHAETLKLKAACWFIYSDTSRFDSDMFNYCGIRTDVGAFNPAPWRYKNVSPGDDPQNPTTGIKAVLDSFGAGGVISATPPVAVTGTADQITGTSARLKGTTNPQGAPTNYQYEFGQAVPYTRTSTSLPVGNGTLAVETDAVVTALQPNTLYHFRLTASNVAGSATGADHTFTTGSATGPPIITVGQAVAVTKDTATLTATIDPHGLAITDYHFQWGTSTSYGNSTTVRTIPAGSGGVPVSEPITGLSPNTTYHFRVVATNSAGTTNGPDATFTSVAVASEENLSRISVLSARLTVEITSADGRVFRWDAEAADTTQRPLEINFATQQGDGFAEGSCQLPRQIDLDWPDLQLLNRVRLIGVDGEVAYEGRIAALPRVVDQDGERIEVQFHGLMASAKDRTFTEIYVDRSAEAWQPPTLALRKVTLEDDDPMDADYTASTDSGSIHFKGTTNKVIPAGSQAMLEYIAPTGVKLSRFAYQGAERNTSNEAAPKLYADDDDSDLMGHWLENLDLDLDNSLNAVQTTTPRSIFGLRIRCQTEHGGTNTPNTAANQRYDKVAVYSDHGLPLLENGTDPEGVVVSDVIADLIERFCPMLTADGIQATDIVLGHLVFDSPTTPFDAFTLLNGYHLYNLGAWEGGKVVFEPADLRNADWQVRSEDLGVTLDLQGDSIDEFANGIVVTYQDIEARDQNLSPDAYDDLRDDDPDNPANKQGIELWTLLEISEAVDQKGALALGRAALAEFNRPKAPGTVTINLGYIEDTQGNLQPGYKVRAGQTLQISDLPNDQPRLITATSWNEDGALQITLEQPSTRVDAVLARLDLASQT